MSVFHKIITQGFTTDTLLSIFACVFVVFCATPIHEFSHALAAFKLGDRTAKFKGRLSLNPLAHIDPIGAAMIFFVGFGYAKPVPVNMRNFPLRKRKLYMGLTALAGPVSNLILAFIMLVFYCGSYKLLLNDPQEIYFNICTFFGYAATINISLAVFNFIPIPPLDGSRIISIVLPDKYYYKIMQYERYIMLALFVLIYIGILDKPLMAVSGFISDLLLKLASLPFGLEV